MKKENITIENSTKAYNNKLEKVNKLKANIENEITKIDQIYEKVDKEVTKSYLEKHEKLTKEENKIKYLMVYQLRKILNLKK